MSTIGTIATCSGIGCAFGFICGSIAAGLNLQRVEVEAALLSYLQRHPEELARLPEEFRPTTNPMYESTGAPKGSGRRRRKLKGGVNVERFISELNKLNAKYGYKVGNTLEELKQPLEEEAYLSFKDHSPKDLEFMFEILKISLTEGIYGDAYDLRQWETLYRLYKAILKRIFEKLPESAPAPTPAPPPKTIQQKIQDFTEFFRSIKIGNITPYGHVRIRDEYMQEVNTAIIKAFGNSMLSILQQSSEGYKKLRAIVLKLQGEPQNITLNQFIEMVKEDYPEKYNKISRKLYKDQGDRIVEYIEFYEDEIVKDFTRIIYSTGKGKGKGKEKGKDHIFCMFYLNQFVLIWL